MAKTFVSNMRFSIPLSLPAPWQGAAWILCSHICFAGINGIVRHWSGGADTSVEVLPTNVMMFFQNLFGTLFLLPWIFKVGVQNLKTQYIGLHLIRVIAAVAGVYLWYQTLKTMPIAEGVALNFTGPIFTMLGATLWLGEKLSVARTIAIALSFSGALIISRPDLVLSGTAQTIGWTALLPLSSALLIAMSKLLTRKLTLLGESATAIAGYLLLLMTPVSLCFALYEWTTPSVNHWPWLILLGALAAAAHFFFAKAYQLAEVSFLTPFGFGRIFFNVLMGFFAFSEFPSAWTLWLGSLIILCSLLLLRFHKIPLYSWARRFKSS